MQPVLDDIFINKNEALIIIIPIAVLAIAVIKGAASYFQSILMSFVGYKMVADLQKEKSDSLKNIAKLRNDAENKLEDALNPIIKKYMEDNNIRMVIDKKAVLLGDTKLEITSQIIEILNKELKSLKIN